jgi:photosystem II stability/assembly factor-like uncharacterized protein
MVFKAGIWSGIIILTLSLAGCGKAAALHQTSPQPPVTQTQPLQLSQITMVSDKNGWALSSQGVVSTTDGGLKWTTRNPKTLTTDLSGSILENIATAFPSSNEAVIAQETTTAIHIWTTKDGGIHWTSEVQKPSESIIQNNFNGKIQMQFTTAQTGLLILASQGNAGSTSDALLQTTDGGINWRVLQESSPGSTFENVDSVAMSPSGMGIASVNTVITGRAEILMTTDGGQSWVSQPLPLPHVSIYQMRRKTPPFRVEI